MAEMGAAQMAAGISSTNEESLLLQRLKRVERSPSGYYAVHTHLSALRANNRAPHFINIASRAFDAIVENHEAVLFPLSNADLVLLCHDVNVDDVDAVIEKVRALFREDPLMLSDDTGYEDKFTTWYDLSSTEDFAAFFSVAADLSVEAEQRRKRESQRFADSGQQEGKPLDPSNLSEINKKLVTMRVADLIHTQTCLQVRTGGGGEVVFNEHFLSMGEIKERIASGINLFASPWLFQYLSETLDKRILSVMATHDYEVMNEPISINLNVSTVLSRDFQAFHKAVDGNEEKVVVEFQVIDVFADIRSYGLARDSLQERGYRVLIDGLNPNSLQYFEPAVLRSDFLKIAWGSEMEDQSDDSKAAELQEVAGQIGTDSIILARVDTERAVKWGLGIGVSRFQGFFIDKLAEVISGGKRR